MALISINVLLLGLVETVLSEPLFFCFFIVSIVWVENIRDMCKIRDFIPPSPYFAAFLITANKTTQ